MLLRTFAIHPRPCRERLILAVEGDIDIATVDQLRETVTDAVDDGWDGIVLDLRRTTFMDSSGAHLLQGLGADDQRDTRIELVPAPEDVMTVLAHLDMEDVLPRIDGLELDLLL